MKILTVSPQLPSPALPRRGLTSNEQFRLLREAGHEVRAVVPVPWAPAGIARPAWQARRRVPAAEMDHGVEIVHPRYLSLGPVARMPLLIDLQRHLYWKALRPLVTSFAANGGRIIHAHSCGLPGCMAGRIGRAKLVISMHDDELFDIVPFSGAQRLVIVDSLRRADAVVYVSPLLMRLATAAAGPHNACVIPMAIDTYDDIRPRQPGVFTISTAARLIARKKIHVLLAAFAALRREIPTARLVIIGDGTERVRLGRLALDLEIAAAVEFTGSLAHREVVARIAESHVFALPSVRESLGTVYFEAMSQSVPVVATVGEGIADYISDGNDGFLVPPDDEAALLRVLRQLHGSTELRNRVGIAGRARFERTKVRWSDFTAAHLRLFERLAASS